MTEATEQTKPEPKVQVRAETFCERMVGDLAFIIGRWAMFLCPKVTIEALTKLLREKNIIKTKPKEEIQDMRFRFEIFKDVKKEWRWRLKAPNNKIIASPGESFKNKKDCLHNIKLVKRNSLTAQIKEPRVISRDS